MIENTVKLAMDFQKMDKTADKIAGSGSVKRMLKRSIAELVEDRFAVFLDESLGDSKLEYYINPWLEGIRPDIMILKNDTIIALIEIKTNFGYCRNIFEGNKSNTKSQIHERIKNVKKLKSGTVTFKKDEISKELRVSPKCLIYYITASTENYISNHSMIDDYHNFIKKYSKYDEYIRFGIVCEKFHDYNSQRVYPTEDEICDGVKKLFKTGHGMNTIIDTIKECSKI